VIHLDTSVLVDALTGARRSAPALRQAIVNGERLGFSVIVLFEWLRGPRSEAELTRQEELLPADAAVPLTPVEASLAARLYRAATRPRGREADLVIAATALAHDASLWTLNAQDFRGLAGLRLYAPSV
jgi:predicted nucleic acid-binding protein